MQKYPFSNEFLQSQLFKRAIIIDKQKFINQRGIGTITNIENTTSFNTSTPQAKPSTENSPSFKNSTKFTVIINWETNQTEVSNKTHESIQESLNINTIP